MCGICGGAVCNGGVCNPSTVSIVYQYAHYGIFVAAGFAAHWWDKIKSFFLNLYKRK